MKAAALIAVSLTLCACGGGSARLSVDAFRARANMVCEKYDAPIRAALGRVAGDPRALARGVTQAVVYLRRGTTDLDALRPPHQYDTTYARYLRIDHAEIAVARKLIAAARTNDAAAIRSAIAQLESQGQQSERLASDMGLDTCASG